MSNQNQIKVAIVDDHLLVRDSIAVMLQPVDDIHVVGTATTGEEILSNLRALSPDVVLMDIVMKGMTGIEATRWIKERNGSIRVILLSGEIRKDFVSAGIQSGIDGYLTKDTDELELVEAIRKVNQGEKYFDSVITSIIFEDFYKKEKINKGPQVQRIIDGLTPRELEVLALVAGGKSNREVAQELSISGKTVDAHKGSVLRKLGLKNVADLVKYAIKNNLIPGS